MLSIEYTEKAILDLDDIWFFIGVTKSSPTNAKRFLTKLRETIDLLTDFPEMGKERSGLKAGLRTLVHGNYIIFYTISEDAVLIERILEGHRDIDTAFGEE